jgi:cytochrome P450
MTSGEVMPGMRQDTLSDEWVVDHFDHLAPEFAQSLHPTLARARQVCPVAHSDQHGGFWVASRYEGVLAVAQEWETWSSELGITVPYQEPPAGMKILPVSVDPPLQRTFKRLINAYFTPRAVAPWEEPTRALVNRLTGRRPIAGCRGKERLRGASMPMCR